ncbi:MAG: hypothetical protein HY885_12665 [Deltaproteobacteria bacterium]|nr:hypothetical protein [Deltaproteobacteria bacterium]
MIFWEIGQVENILAMFKLNESHYRPTGELEHDERFMVRMGVAVFPGHYRIKSPKA